MTCIVDATNEVREALGRAPLTDASGGVTGVGGVHKGKEKDKLRVVTSDKQITICESRKVSDLGVNGNVNLRFNESARLEIGTDCLDSRFIRHWSLRNISGA